MRRVFTPLWARRCLTWDYEDALAAVIAGVDGINHGVVSEAIPDDRLAREMVARGTCYIPTLRLLDAIAPPLLPVAKENLRLLHAEGVTIVMGSDTPVGWTYPGVNSLFEIEFQNSLSCGLAGRGQSQIQFPAFKS